MLPHKIWFWPLSGISLIDCVTDERNPFTRLYSAWNDKSRTHRFQNGSILPEGKGFHHTFDPFCISVLRFGSFYHTNKSFTKTSANIKSKSWRNFRFHFTTNTILDGKFLKQIYHLMVEMFHGRLLWNMLQQTMVTKWWTIIGRHNSTSVTFAILIINILRIWKIIATKLILFLKNWK